MPSPSSARNRAARVSGLTDALTGAIGDAGVYAVFALMLLDAVFPAGSEIVMLYAGALAAGAFPATVPGCFGSAGAGLALGAGWERVHEDFRYADYVALGLAAAGLAFLAARSLRRRTRAV